MLTYVHTYKLSLYYSAAVQHQHSPTESLLHAVGYGVCPDAAVGVRIRGLSVHWHEVRGAPHVEPVSRVVEQAVDSRGQEAVEPVQDLFHLEQFQVHKHKHLKLDRPELLLHRCQETT